MKNLAIELKWGIIFFAISLLWMVIEKVSGLHGRFIEYHPYLTSLFALPAIGIFILAIREKRDTFYEGKITWRQGFTSGFIISIIIAILSPLGQVIIHLYLSPEYFENAIAFSYENNYYNSLDEARGFFNLQSYLIQSVIAALFLGIITSSIASIFLKKTSD